MHRRRRSGGKRITWTLAVGVPLLVIAALFFGMRWVVTGLFDVAPPHAITEQEARQAMTNRGVHIPRSFSLDQMRVTPVFSGAPRYVGSFSAPLDRFEDYHEMVAASPEMAEPRPEKCTPAAQYVCSPENLVTRSPDREGQFDVTTIRILRDGDRARLAIDAQGH